VYVIENVGQGGPVKRTFAATGMSGIETPLPVWPSTAAPGACCLSLKTSLEKYAGTLDSA